VAGMSEFRGFAGASAQREAARMRREQERDVANAHPAIQAILRESARHSRDVAAWERGAIGETIVGRVLDGLDRDGVRVLHDRAMPGRSANIDHIAVARSGVYVIDAKHYSGRPRAESRGTGARLERRLYIGRDDHTHLVEGVRWQARVVEAVLAVPGIPVRGVLCFIGADWSLTRGFAIDDVGVTEPDRLPDLLRMPGPLPTARIDELRARLEAALSSA